MKRLPLLLSNELKTYFMKHVHPDSKPRTDFYVVKKPLHVFKKLVRGRVAYLIIPVGASVYAPACAWTGRNDFYLDTRKMRASEAHVQAIYSQRSKKNFSKGEADFQPVIQLDHCCERIIFKYVVGQTVKPSLQFSYQFAKCASGIHFFLNVQDALDW